MSIFVVGDLQGCYDPFRRLLDRAKFDPTQDRLWLVGDLVNRGPQNVEVLRFVMALGESAIAVLGNHDLSLLMYAEGFGKRGKGDTIEDVLAAPDRDELLDWLRRRPLMHLEDGIALVHAGLLPDWTVEQAQGLAKEVEVVLAGHRYRELLANMWGSEPSAWSDDLAGWARLRVVVNAMTRLRFCTPGGVMEFKTKGEVDAAPSGCLPWFAVPGRRSAGSTIVCGHWSALGLRVEPEFIALDSGCLWGRELSGIWLPSRQVIQVPCTAAD